MKYRAFGIVAALALFGTLLPEFFIAQTVPILETDKPHGPYARIAVMRALDGHGVEWEAGYIRHLEWHRQAHDPFAWYSYSIWASAERQRWIIYATFGHTAAELSDPVSPAEDERDNLINVLPHTEFMEWCLRIHADTLPWKRCTNTYSSRRVHHGGTQPGN